LTVINSLFVISVTGVDAVMFVAPRFALRVHGLQSQPLGDLGFTRPDSHSICSAHTEVNASLANFAYALESLSKHTA
jgi:hypothetical protein